MTVLNNVTAMPTVMTVAAFSIQDTPHIIATVCNIFILIIKMYQAEYSVRKKWKGMKKEMCVILVSGKKTVTGKFVLGQSEMTKYERV